jgi:hypothetical protein
MPGQDGEKKDFKITQNFVPYYSAECQLRASQCDMWINKKPFSFIVFFRGVKKLK